MNNDINNISPNDNNEADKLNLLHALNNDTFNDEDLFEADASEGLQQMNEHNVAAIVNKLNADLHHQIKKKKKQRRGIPSQQGLYITIITILLLAVIAYIVIKKAIS
jgi:LDH2 family malate/lactate/ureidoglycolate dehydrogenase